MRDRFDRRKILKATGSVVGVGALAGCGEPNSDDEDSVDEDAPVFEGTIQSYDPAVQFLIRSSEYQDTVLAGGSPGEPPKLNFRTDDYDQATVFLLESAEWRNKKLKEERG